MDLVPRFMELAVAAPECGGIGVFRNPSTQGAEFGLEQSQTCPQLATTEFAIRNVNVVDACHFF